MIEENNGRAVMRFSAPVTKVQSLADGGWQLTIRPGQDSAAAAAMLFVIAMDTENMIDWVATERVRKYQPVTEIEPDLDTEPTLDDALDGIRDPPREDVRPQYKPLRTRHLAFDSTGGVSPS